MFVIFPGNTAQNPPDQKEQSMEKAYSVSSSLANHKTLDPASMPRQYPRIGLRSLGTLKHEEESESPTSEMSREIIQDLSSPTRGLQSVKQEDGPLSTSSSINNMSYKRKSILINNSMESLDESVSLTQSENKNDTEDDTSEISTIHLKNIQSSPQTNNSTGDIDDSSFNYSNDDDRLVNAAHPDTSIDSAAMLIDMNDDVIVNSSDILRNAFSDYQQEIDKLEYGVPKAIRSTSSGAQSQESSLTFEQERTSHQMSARQALSGNTQHQNAFSVADKDTHYAPRHVLTIPSLSIEEKERFHVFQYPGFISVQESAPHMFSQYEDDPKIKLYRDVRYCRYADCFSEPLSSAPLTGLKRTSLMFN